MFVIRTLAYLCFAMPGLLFSMEEEGAQHALRLSISIQADDQLESAGVHYSPRTSLTPRGTPRAVVYARNSVEVPEHKKETSPKTTTPSVWESSGFLHKIKCLTRVKVKKRSAKKGASTPSGKRRKVSCLLKAMESGEYVQVDKLLKAGEDLSYCVIEKEEGVPIHYGALWIATRNLDTTLLYSLYSNSAYKEKIIYQEPAILILLMRGIATLEDPATLQQVMTITQLHLEQGIDPNVQDRLYSEAALHALVKHVPNNTDPKKQEAFLQGVKKLIGLLVEWHADIDITDKIGRTPLLWALRTGQEKVSRILIKKGAQVYWRTHDGAIGFHTDARKKDCRDYIWDMPTFPTLLLKDMVMYTLRNKQDSHYIDIDEVVRTCMTYKHTKDKAGFWEQFTRLFEEIEKRNAESIAASKNES